MQTPGSPRVILRIPAFLLEKLTRVIAEMNANRSEEPLTPSEWIRRAIIEKLAKRERSRSRRKKLDLAGPEVIILPASDGTDATTDNGMTVS